MMHGVDDSSLPVSIMIIQYFSLNFFFCIEKAWDNINLVIYQIQHTWIQPLIEFKVT
jgi:hypothetical protein